MTQLFDVDGNEFGFPDDWTVFVYDNWAYYRRNLQPSPLNARGCDLVAHNGQTLHLIEAKDYSRPGSQPWPGVNQLADTVARKGFDTLAGILAGAKSGGDKAAECESALRCERLVLCLSIEFDARLSRSIPKMLADLKDGIARRAKYTRGGPLIASNRVGVKPWTSRRTWHLPPP